MLEKTSGTGATASFGIRSRSWRGHRGGGGACAGQLGRRAPGGGGSVVTPHPHRRNSVRSRIVVHACAPVVRGAVCRSPGAPKGACPAPVAPHSSAAPSAAPGATRSPRQATPGPATPIGPWPPPYASVGSRHAVLNPAVAAPAGRPPRQRHNAHVPRAPHDSTILCRTACSDIGHRTGLLAPSSGHSPCHGPAPGLGVPEGLPGGRLAPGLATDAAHRAAMPAPPPRGVGTQQQFGGFGGGAWLGLQRPSNNHYVVHHGC